MNAIVRHVTGARPVSIQTTARRMLDEAGGDLNSATEKLINYVSALPRLQMEVIRIGARKLINEVPQTDRRAVEREFAMTDSGNPFAKAPHRMNAAAKTAQARIRARAGHLRNTLLTLPYVIGNICKPLGEWTGSEILTHGETQLMSGATQIRNARFLIAVGHAAGAGKIGAVLDEDAIQRLKVEAESSAV